ncbi:MAG: septum formation protein [Paracoccaceae bacterium]|jgi:septum formation protein
MTDQIILASTSEIRRSLLRNAGVEFTTIAARIDEQSITASLLAENASPRDIADHLAEMKALRISQKFPDALVIGSDQVLEHDGKVLDKPSDLTAAHQQLRQLRRSKHTLLSAAVVVRGGKPLWRHVGQTRLWMRDFSDEYLQSYLERQGNDVLSSVGSYKLESEGIRLFAKIEGDYFNVLGIPLLELLNYLATSGVIQK